MAAQLGRQQSGDDVAGMTDSTRPQAVGRVAEMTTAKQSFANRRVMRNTVLGDMPMRIHGLRVGGSISRLAISPPQPSYSPLHWAFLCLDRQRWRRFWALPQDWHHHRPGIPGPASGPRTAQMDFLRGNMAEGARSLCTT